MTAQRHAANIDLTETQNGLRLSPLFANLPASSLHDLAMKSHIMRSRKRQLLFIHEDRAEHCFLIRKGHVKLFRESEQGNEVVLDILTDGHLFGETAVFNQGLYSYSAETVGDAELIVFPAGFIDALVRDDHGFCRDMLAYMAARTLDKEKEIEARALQEAPQRIGCFLLSLCDRTEGGAAALDLPYEKTVIADRLGMRPETFSRALLKLQKDLKLEIMGAHIIIGDLQAFRDYICANCAHQGLCQKNEEYG